MVPGIQIQKILQSYILLTTVKILTMEKQILQVQDVVRISMIGVIPMTITPIHSMPKKCAVYAEEVLIMIKPHLMAYGIISMDPLELGL